MDTVLLEPATEERKRAAGPRPANWVVNAALLWEHRRLLMGAAGIALMVGLAIAFLIPKRYTSTGKIMPPDNSGSSTAMFAALAGRSLGEVGGLGSLAGSLLGGRNSSALFVDLLRSGTVSGALIDRYDLQHVWHKRYRVDTAKYLARHTTIVDDKRSGVITVEVEDTDPRRARDIAQGYLEELDKLVRRTNTSSAHQERIFIEGRLQGVEADLKRAQVALSEFSSTHTTIDLANQTRAMVDAAARLQGEQIAAQTEVDSLRQIYGDQNVRVRAAEARVAELRHELEKMSGSSAAEQDEGVGAGGAAANGAGDELYPPLRQLPRLAAPYSDLYRRVRVQEAVYELLTQQYEISRIEEAKDVAVVSVIDAPGIPEKKSFPPRLLVALLFTLFDVGATAMFVLFRQRWRMVGDGDARKVLAREIAGSLREAAAGLGRSRAERAR
ncbi:MAG TPA: Wzz/FepE/Etk N-terminal domain-containing protein [Acidobacteriaceae bacterium]|jgi:capsule polysaccharide export protein KpsE/RkpR